MPRAAVPDVDKVKDRILELTEDEQQIVHDWLVGVFEVREGDRKAAEKRAAKLNKEQS